MLGIPSLLMGLVLLSRRQARRHGPTIATHADELAQVVAAQWKAEAARRSMQYPIPVRWRLSGHAEVMDHPRHLGAQPFEDGPFEISELVDKFRELPSQRLVVLGGPGSGKTCGRTTRSSMAKRWWRAA